MRALATALFVLVGPASFLADGRTELEILRARCLEQERQIRALETEIESLHSQVALERRRARGVDGAPPVALITSAAPAPVKSETYVVKNGDTLSSIARRYHTSADVLMKQNGIEDATKLRVGQKLVLKVEKPAAKPVAPAPKPQTVATKPAAKPAPAKPAPKASGSYKVVRGDTLFGIARKHGMSLSTIQELNPKLNSGKIIVGQTIAVNGKAKAPKPAQAGFRSSSTKTISTRSTAPAPRKPAPAPAVKKSTPKPAPAPAPVAKKEAPKPAPAPKTITTIILMEELTFGDFAKKHGTTTDQLNALNNLDLKSDITLAKGSELYVPGK